MKITLHRLTPNKSFSHHTINGFTLIEMLVVISIIVVLAGLSMVGFRYIQTKQANEKARTQIKLLEVALEDFKSDMGAYPASENSDEGKKPQSRDGSTVLFNALYWDSDFDKEGLTDEQGKTRDENQKVYLPLLDPRNPSQGWASSKEVTESGSRSSNKILDPWGMPYQYRSNKAPGSGGGIGQYLATGNSRNKTAKNPDFDLWSLGPDGQEGDDKANNGLAKKQTGDNISNY
jgi:general secretion pathway protein G